jgi:hypothetical protein
MRNNARVIVAASAFAASALCAQTPSPTPGAGPAATNTPAPSAPAQNARASSAPVRPRSGAAPADARVCLEFPTNLQVIQCAEKYRRRQAPA